MLTRIRHLLTSLWYHLTSPSYRLLGHCGLFDAAYYLENNPDVKASGAEPLAHYLFKGFAELRTPSPFFDRVFYQHQCPGLDESKINPVIHFLQQGRYQSLRPNILVDPQHYAHVNAPFAATGLDPLRHFLRHGKTGLPPSPYFDAKYYCSKYPDVAHMASDCRAAYRHFLTIGLKENRRPGLYFDTAFYLDKAPGLDTFGLHPLSHYCMFGCRESKSPSPLFDPMYYRKNCKLPEDTDPYAHYLCHQTDQDLQPCAWFDPLFYRRTYLGNRRDITPFDHFLTTGLTERLAPNHQVYELVNKPVISVLVPVYNPTIAALNTCIRSVVYQSYPHWELCLADDSSTDPDILPILTQWAKIDPRIKVVSLPENSGIAAATDAAASLAGGSYLAFLDNDDELAPIALQSFATNINSKPADLYYSDEDLIGADGRQFSIFRKPGFNSELLLCHNYVTHCVLTKKTLFDEVGGCSREMNGAQDLDLFLKLSELADAVVHIPEILYHWRASETSTSINHEKKHYADEAGRKSIAQAMARRGISGDALFTDWKFFYRAKRSLVARMSVTLVVDWEQPADDLHAWLHTLLETSGHTITQVVLLTGEHGFDGMADYYAKTSGIDTLLRTFPSVIGSGERFQAILPDITGELVAYVSGFLDRPGDHWLAALVEYGQDLQTGMVGGRIEYPPEDTPSITPIADSTTTSPWYYIRFLCECSVLMNGRQCPQEVLGLGGELFLVRRDFLACSNLDATDFPSLFAFSDLSLCLHQQGKKNIYTPYCTASFNSEALNRLRQISSTSSREEMARFQKKWFSLLENGNPYYNPRLISDNGGSEDEFTSWLTGRSISFKE